MAKGFIDPIVDEVRRNREQLLEKYGSIEGLHKHMAETRPILEEQGWKFVTINEIIEKNRANKNITRN